MLLVSATIDPFKSINKTQKLDVDQKVTVLVGMNEAGKTVILQSMQKSEDALGLAKFDHIEDYPRKDLPQYLKRHATTPEKIIALTYQLTDAELTEANNKFHTALPKTFTYTETHFYNNSSTINIAVDETPVIKHLAHNSGLSAAASGALFSVTNLRAIPKLLEAAATTAEDKAFVQTIQARIGAVPAHWSNLPVVAHELWTWLEPRKPKFLYFGDYELLPSKMNLADLASKAGNPAALNSESRGVLALLRMADISINDFANPGGYEPLKAKIEGVSINLTDQIMEFWKQNEDLEVEVDIKSDVNDQPPYNNGPNLYLRIKNRRHRGVSTPFRQRSRGFIWFFSFLVWFDSVQHQFQATEQNPARPLILLLDEPGLSLHALAQADFLKYIDELAKKHQVLYTTHSPFMVHAERLHQVRLVEDRPKEGTVVSASHLQGQDPRTIFPLQAALGWTIAQNLFIGERNLLVEGPADLIFLKLASGVLEAAGRIGLREDIVIAPAGGLEKVATFVALLGANHLKLAVLHDYAGAPDQRLLDLVKHKMISAKAVLNASQFADLANLGKTGKPADLEDLFPVKQYLHYFNRVYSKALGGKTIKESDLPPGDRVIDRIERHLAVNSISVQPSGGFNHYLVASEFAAHPPSTLDDDTLARFEALCKAVNALF